MALQRSARATRSWLGLPSESGAWSLLPLLVIHLLLVWSVALVLQPNPPGEVNRPYADDTLGEYTGYFVASSQSLGSNRKADSWGPMLLALEHLHNEPNVLLYSKVFFENGQKFQYPPSSLVALDLLQKVTIGISGT